MSGFEVERESLRGFAEAGTLLARGLQDNPMTVAVFRCEVEERFAINDRIFRALLKMRKEPILYAHAEGRMVGVVAASRPNQCRPSFLQGLPMIPPILRMGRRHLRRFSEWTSALSKFDPTEPHWHLGPVAVELAWRGTGVGSALMSAFIDKMDQRGDYAYLETDKPENVTFYRRFGFELMSESDLLGAHNWFMDRRPQV